eukprot:CAMPEP_0197926668 /NCGR_PEP_ID=MMETSP1439-20131203/99474_1 /TAXON_ID=66791 /ORGANISM="Gonyaulax spinifera, Strain CCMP409" /LENGTH=925 /DNA_ID=CAMNT_0043549207 /DNA_START=161 /DNA_END=2937 /DNA_ORIENTATION=-
MEAALQSIGHVIGRRPCCIAYLVTTTWVVFVFGLISGYRRNLMNPAEFERQWSTTGSSKQAEIEAALELWQFEKRWDWEQQYVLMMVSGKGDMLGKDIVTASVFEEVETAMEKWFKGKVTTSRGNTFQAHHLCARLALPDIPGAIPVEPCQVMSVFDCFQEMHQHVHPSYQPVDKTIQVADPTNQSRTVKAGYYHRPSYKVLSDADIKRILTNGCPWYQNQALWPASQLLARPKMENGVVVEAKHFALFFYYEGPERAAFRLSHPARTLLDPTEPVKNSNWTHAEWLADIRGAQRRHVQDFADSVIDASRKSSILEFSFMYPDRQITEILEEGLEEAPLDLMMIGVGLMVWLMLMLVNFRNGLDSRLWVSLLGLGCVLLSLGASMGIAVYLGIYFNAVVMSGLPFLIVGLGLDDMFVLTRTFSDLGRKHIYETQPRLVVEQVLTRAGTGVLLTSICNSVAFGLGAMIPVASLADFCLCTTIAAVMNFITMTTLFMCCLYLEAFRIKTRMPEPICCCCQLGFCCCCLPEAWPCSPAIQKESEKYDRVAGALDQKYAPCMGKAIVHLPVVLVMLVMLVLSIYSIVNKEIGYKPAQLAKSDTPLARGLDVYFDNFNVYPGAVFFWDVDVPARQQEMADLYGKVTSLEFTTPWPTPHYLTFFHMFNPHLAAISPGAVNRTQWYAAFHDFAAFPASANAALAKLGQGDLRYIYSDLGRVNEFAWWPAEDPMQKRLRLSYFPFIIRAMKTPSDFVEVVIQVQKIVDDSSFKDSKAFPYGVLFVYWDVFIKLEGILLKVFLMDLAVIFFASVVCLMSVSAAAVTTIMCTVIVLEVYGICMQFILFNMFMASILLASAGIAVEDVAHSIAHFVTEEGAPVHRLSGAMRTTFPAIIQGVFVDHAQHPSDGIPSDTFLSDILFLPLHDGICDGTG